MKRFDKFMVYWMWVVPPLFCAKLLIKYHDWLAVIATLIILPLWLFGARLASQVYKMKYDQPYNPRKR
jgi:hypothetical protein